MFVQSIGVCAYILFNVTLLFFAGPFCNAPFFQAYAPGVLNFHRSLGFTTLDLEMESTRGSSSIGSAFWSNLFWMLLFCVSHIIMARLWFKAMITQYIPPALERSNFVVTSSLILLAMMKYWSNMPQIIWSFPPATSFIGKLLAAGQFFGIFIMLSSSFMIDHWEMFGIRQTLWPAGNAPDFKKSTVGGALIATGWYKFVRHPMMTGGFFMFGCAPVMTYGHMMLAIGMTLFILIAVSQFEEPDLRKTLGTEYIEYEKQVPCRFFPFPISTGKPKSK